MEKQSAKQGIRFFLFLLACAFVTALNASDNPFYIGVKLRDSSVFTYMGNLILQGGMPYRDAFDHKGPLVYLINALGLAVHAEIGVWLLEFLTVFLFLFLSYRIARLLECSRPLGCCTVLLAMLSMAYYFNWGNMTEEYAMVPIAFSLWAFVKHFRTGKVRWWELVLCGMSFAAVCLLRINMAALWVVMCPGVLVHCIRHKKGAELLKFIALFLAGAAALTVPAAIWLACGGALDAFIQDYFIFNLAYSKSNLLHKLNVLAVFASQATAVLAVAPLIWFWLRERKAVDGLCLLASLFSLLMMSLSGQNYQHYGLILVPLFVYSAARTLKALAEALEKKPASFRRMAAAAAACTVLLMFAQSFVSFSTVALPTPKKSEALAADRQIAQVIRVYTSPEDAISVCGNNDRIYLLAGRKSASVYSYQYPLADVDAGIRAQYLEDMKAGTAKMIIMDGGEEAETFLVEDMAPILEAGYTHLEKIGAADLWLKN